MRHALGFAGFVLACVSCTLLVDTDALTGGGGARDAGSSGASSSGAVPDASVVTNAEYDLAIEPATLSLDRPGASGEVLVSIDRHGSFTGTVTVVLAENRAGLQAASLVLDGTRSAGTLVVTSALDARIGTTTLDVVGASGASGELRATRPLSVHIGRAAGTLDTDFGSGGVALLAVGAGNTHAYNIAVQPDGKPVLSGYCRPGTHDFFAARLNVNGSLDTSFAGGALAVDIVGKDDYGTGVALLPDGRVFLSGSALRGTKVDLALVRLGANGLLDPTFGPESNGKVVHTASTLSDSGERMFLVGDKILVSGGHFFASRFDAKGTIDTTYGTGGTVQATVGTIQDSSFAAVLQEDGKLVVGGATTIAQTDASIDRDWALTRFTAEGKVDPTFGKAGVVRVRIGSGKDELSGIALQADGKLVVAGSDPTRAIVARLLGDGSLDPTFGKDGYVYLPSPKGNAFSGSLLVTGSKIVVTGSRADGGNFDVFVARLDERGALDPSFGTGGMMIAPVGAKDDDAYGITEAPNGFLYVTGDYNTGARVDAFLLRVWP